MTTTHWPNRARRRIALAVALACSASVLPAGALEPNQANGSVERGSTGQVVQGSQGQGKQALRRLPGVEDSPAAITVATALTAQPEFEGAAWKTKMVFERLELRAANESSERRTPGALHKCSAESNALATDLNGGVPSLSGSQGGDQVRWLRSSSASDCARRARVLIERGSIEYASGALLSAESTVWEAVRCAAEGIDLQERELAKAQLGIRRRTATGRLQLARTAILEARDFAGVDETADGRAISRMAISHSTNVLDGLPCDDLRSSDAADRYLDAARVSMAEVASRSVEAAQGMDWLAAIYLKQNDDSKLHSATALCLWRAALQGQPENSNLASRLGMHLLDIGLLEEASWALSHSLSIEKDNATAQAYIAVLQQTGRQAEAQQVIAALQPAQRSIVGTDIMPTITELSPQGSAAISKPVVPASMRGYLKGTTAMNWRGVPPQSQAVIGQDQVSAVSGQLPQHGEPLEIEAKPSVFKRFVGAVKKIW